MCVSFEIEKVKQQLETNLRELTSYGDFEHRLAPAHRGEDRSGLAMKMIVMIIVIMVLMVMMMMIVIVMMVLIVMVAMVIMVVMMIVIRTCRMYLLSCK